MRINTYNYPKSSFLSIDKDMNIIVDQLLKNERLKKLLFYTSKDCLSKPNLSDEETFSMFGKHIKIIPKLYVDKEVLNYIIISFDNFSTNSTNPEFRDNLVEFDIICHFDQWHLQGFDLRPYKIAAEIDTMFDKKHLTGIGQLNLLGVNQLLLNNEFSGLCMMYQTIHGEEDRKNAEDPVEDMDLIENFNNIFNQK